MTVNDSQLQNQMEEAFRQYNRDFCFDRVRVLFSFFMVLAPLFGLLDLVVVPRELFGLFMIFRLGCLLSLILLWSQSSKNWAKARPAWLGILASMIMGGLISLLTRYLGGYESSYYVGLNLLTLGVTLVLPLSLLESLFACVTVYGTYLIPILILDRITRHEVFITNNSFLVGTAAIALVSTYYSHRLRFREFQFRYQLSLGNERLRALDQEKTLIFNNFGQLVSSGLDWRSVIRSVLKLIKENFGLDRAVCLYWEKPKQILGRPLVAESHEAFLGRLSEFRFKLQENSKLLSLLQAGRPFVVLRDETTNEDMVENQFLDLFETSSLLVLPFKEKGEPSSVLLLDAGVSPAPLSDSRFQLLVSLSPAISVALEKARLFESEQKRTAQLLVIHEISRAISSILDFKAVSKEFAHLLQRNFGYDHVSIFNADDRGHLVLNAMVDTRAGLSIPDELLSTEDRNICLAQRSRKSISEVVTDDETTLEGALHQGGKSQLCIPYNYSTRTLGVINVEKEAADGFEEQDIRVLETLSDYLATWVNNANLYTDIGRKANALQTLNSIGKAISSELNINNLFELIYSQVRQVLKAKTSLLRYWREVTTGSK